MVELDADMALNGSEPWADGSELGDAHGAARPKRRPASHETGDALIETRAKRFRQWVSYNGVKEKKTRR